MTATTKIKRINDVSRKYNLVGQTGEAQYFIERMIQLMSMAIYNIVNFISNTQDASSLSIFYFKSGVFL